MTASQRLLGSIRLANTEQQEFQSGAVYGRAEPTDTYQFRQTEDVKPTSISDYLGEQYSGYKNWRGNNPVDATAVDAALDLGAMAYFAYSKAGRVVIDVTIRTASAIPYGRVALGLVTAYSFIARTYSNYQSNRDVADSRVSNSSYMETIASELVERFEKETDAMMEELSRSMRGVEERMKNAERRRRASSSTEPEKGRVRDALDGRTEQEKLDRFDKMDREGIRYA